MAAHAVLTFIGGSMYSWHSFITSNWTALVAGKELWTNVHPSAHPRLSPLFKANSGWPVGQQCDYTASFQDGSRIHAQCFGVEHGLLRVRVHRDQFDPDQGFFNFVLHGLLETPVVPMVAAAALLSKAWAK